MNEAILFFGKQVVLLIVMLFGMFLGELVTGFLFEKTLNFFERCLYSFIFIVFLVLGSWVPDFLAVSEMDFYAELLFFSFWGFVCVLMARLGIPILSVPGFLSKKKRCLRRQIYDVHIVRANMEKSGLPPEIVAGVAAASFSPAGFFNRILHKDRIYIDRVLFSNALVNSKLTVRRIIGLLVRVFSISPEQAILLYEKSDKEKS